MAERRALPISLWAMLAVLAAGLFAYRVIDAWPSPDSVEGDLQSVIFSYSVLPRAAVALLAGASLGLSGLLLQRVLRNPIAEPSTLGISSGAQLAMAAATMFAPAWMVWSAPTVAFAGGITAVALVLALTWRRGLEPVSVVLAGMMVALVCNSASAALILANGEYLFSLFIWGGGSLVQQSWAPSFAIAVPLALGICVAALMLRPLAILGLDDASAKNLGIAINASRLGVVALAVWIATTVTAEVGVIGFVGLAAPALAGLSGARSLKQRLVAAPLIGAILLWLTDGLVQALSGAEGERIPTGAATALLGGPLLLWLLPRLRMFEWPSLGRPAVQPRRSVRPWRIVLIVSTGTIVAAVVAFLVGQGPEGWFLATDGLAGELVDWRAPRIIAAAAAGAMLGAAGTIIQRLTGNPLASPEVLGVGAGAGAGLAAVILFDLTAGLGWRIAGSAVGSLAVLFTMLAIAARANFGPERLLLAGIAMSALCSSLLTAVIALGNAQSYILLGWLSGSTSDVTPLQARIAIGMLIFAAILALLAARWLDILPLGANVSRGLGLPLKRARFLMVALTALITAFASIFVGPLSFIGLIAPHLARLSGLSRAREHLLGSILIGAMLMILSNWLARMATFPYQLPVGLFASLVSGPYLVYLLGKGVQRHG